MASGLDFLSGMLGFLTGLGSGIRPDILEAERRQDLRRERFAREGMVRDITPEEAARLVGAEQLRSFMPIFSKQQVFPVAGTAGQMIFRQPNKSFAVFEPYPTLGALPRETLEALGVGKEVVTPATTQTTAARTVTHPPPAIPEQWAFPSQYAPGQWPAAQQYPEQTVPALREQFQQLFQPQAPVPFQAQGQVHPEIRKLFGLEGRTETIPEKTITTPESRQFQVEPGLANLPVDPSTMLTLQFKLAQAQREAGQNQQKLLTTLQTNLLEQMIKGNISFTPQAMNAIAGAKTPAEVFRAAQFIQREGGTKATTLETALQMIQTDPNSLGRARAMLINAGYSAAETNAILQAPPRSGVELEALTSALYPGQSFFTLAPKDRMAVLDAQLRRQVQISAAQGAAGASSRIEVEYNSPTPLNMVNRLINPKTMEPFPLDTTRAQANAQGGVMLTETASNTLAELRGAEALFDQMDALMQKIYGPGGPYAGLTQKQGFPGRLTGALQAKMLQATQSNPDLIVLNGLFQGFLAKISRNVGQERGQVTEADATRTKQTLPVVIPQNFLTELPDTKEVAMQKMATLRALVNEIKRRTVTAGADSGLTTQFFAPGSPGTPTTPTAPSPSQTQGKLKPGSKVNIGGEEGTVVQSWTPDLTGQELIEKGITALGLRGKDPQAWTAEDQQRLIDWLDVETQKRGIPNPLRMPGSAPAPSPGQTPQAPAESHPSRESFKTKEDLAAYNLEMLVGRGEVATRQQALALLRQGKLDPQDPRFQRILNTLPE